MNISTDTDFFGTIDDHSWAAQFTVLSYKDGGQTLIPHGFFRDWLGNEPDFGQFAIGRCSGIGIGSQAKYDSTVQRLQIGRYVSGGANLRFILNGQHDMRTISTYMLALGGMGLENSPIPQYADTVIKNDVWIGDEAMILGGAVIENGCVIGARTLVPPNFRSEPYGIYAGTPARLVRFRFSAQVRAALLALAWWELPLTWIRENNAHFLQDLTTDDGEALRIIAELAESKRRHLEAGAGNSAGHQHKDNHA